MLQLKAKGKEKGEDAFDTCLAIATQLNVGGFMTAASLLPPYQLQRRGEGASTPTPATDTKNTLRISRGAGRVY